MNIQLLTPQLDNSLVKAHDIMPKGHLRIQTGFLYPDGSSIDVFVKHDNSLLSGLSVRLTDFGNTSLWLSNMQIRPIKNKKRLHLLENILSTYDISRSGGALECSVPIDSLMDGVIRIGQACLRMSDLMFTQRFRATSDFAEDVEEVIAEFGLPYESDIAIPGHKGRPVLVDFKIDGPRAPTAILTLFGSSKVQANRKADDVFTRVYDLKDWSGQCITTFDDRNSVFSDEDLERIETICPVIPFSEKNTLKQLIIN